MDINFRRRLRNEILRCPNGTGRNGDFFTVLGLVQHNKKEL